jgi:hypothetical protein
VSICGCIELLRLSRLTQLPANDWLLLATSACPTNLTSDLRFLISAFQHVSFSAFALLISACQLFSF